MIDRSDRHKVPRQYMSGAQKKKLSTEKEKDNEEIIKKCRKMEQFLKTPSDSVPSKSTSVQYATESEITVESKIDAGTAGSNAEMPEKLKQHSCHCQEQVEQHQSQTDEQPDEEPKQPDEANAYDDNSINCRCDITDIGLWPAKLPSEIQEYWIKKGSTKLQNATGTFKKSIMNNRSCTTQMFQRVLLNGESIARSWLCYSPVADRVFCFQRKLLNVGQGAMASDGFNDWPHATRCLNVHEKSTLHCNAVIEVTRLMMGHGRIDQQLIEQVYYLTKYWKDVLRRVVSVIKFLGERGLAIRGDNEIIGSPKNGNFLGLIELLGEYDTVLAKHIQKHANKGSGHTSYLSSTTAEEFIVLMGKKIRSTIVSQVTSAKYYSVSVDSTPDNSHTDQLTCVIRYVEAGGPVERFLTFLDSRGHTGQKVALALLEFLTEIDIDIENCRGQTYDNAANMSDKYNGMQTIVKERNPLATYTPCSAHSLNLVGQAAVDCCSTIVAFFNFVQQLYN